MEYGYVVWLWSMVIWSMEYGYVVLLVIAKSLKLVR